MLGPRPADPARADLSSAQATVLQALRAADSPATVTELAAELRQHPNTVREHLDALVTAGRAERVKSDPVGRGRPAWLYHSVTSEALPGTDSLGINTVGVGHEYTSLALALIDQVVSSSPEPQELARKAGERWGRSLAQEHCARANRASAAACAPGPSSDASDEPTADDGVVEILDDLRFSPESSGDDPTVRLTTCPILDAARRNPTVVCQVHLGIVRGALEQFGADPDSADLTAFAEPGACLLTLHDR